jgi:predicted dehydrogenase
MGDMFQDRLDACRSNLKKLGDKADVSADRCFTGFDAYKNVIESGVDLVILATPPGFRPMHLAAAIEAGKHVFTEKPVAVDAPGIRTVLAAAEEAKKKGLAVVAGTQRRHQKSYLESMRRIHDGEIGEITSARCYWNQGGLWMKPASRAGPTSEWQLRNWLYFTWLSGDHICEQHVHNLDVVNWALGRPPRSAPSAWGGRRSAPGPSTGISYDHFAVDYEYPQRGPLAEHVPADRRELNNCLGGRRRHQGALAEPGPSHRGCATGGGTGPEGKDVDPYLQEHIDLIASIREGKPLNELRTVAESTLTAIMGRMSAYTGKAVTWDEALQSKENLMPEKLVLGDLKVAPIPVPGQTELI